MSQKKPATPHGSLWVDLRLPFALSATVGLLFLILFTVLAALDIPYLSYIGLGLVILYTLIAGVTFLAYALRYTNVRRAEETAEELNTDIYRMFRTTVDVPYAVVSEEGTVRVINAAMQSILGLRSPVCSIPLEEICHGVTVDRLAACTDIFLAIQDLGAQAVVARLTQRANGEMLKGGIQIKSHKKILRLGLG